MTRTMVETTQRSRYYNHAMYQKSKVCKIIVGKWCFNLKKLTFMIAIYDINYISALPRPRITKQPLFENYLVTIDPIRFMYLLSWLYTQIKYNAMVISCLFINSIFRRSSFLDVPLRYHSKINLITLQSRMRVN